MTQKYFITLQSKYLYLVTRSRGKILLQLSAQHFAAKSSKCFLSSKYSSRNSKKNSFASFSCSNKLLNDMNFVSYPSNNYLHDNYLFNSITLLYIKNVCIIFSLTSLSWMSSSAQWYSASTQAYSSSTAFIITEK